MGGTRRVASIGIAAGALMALIALIAPGLASSQSAVATVSITPASQSATVGDTVTVTVKVEDATNVAAYDLMILYDTGVLEFVERRDLEFIQTSGRVVTCPSPVVDTKFKVGSVQAGCVSDGLTPPGASGDADLMEFKFKAKARGTSDLVFYRVNLADPNGDSCCGDYYLNVDEGGVPVGDMIIREAAVAVGQTSDPPAPATPEPDRARRTKRAPVNGQLPAYETLPDTPGNTSSSGSAESETGTGRSATSRNGNSRSSGGVRGSSSSQSGASGSGDFPVAGQGYRDEPESPWVLTLAYGLAGAGVALAAGTAGFEEWRRRRTGRP